MAWRRCFFMSLAMAPTMTAAATPFRKLRSLRPSACAGAAEVTASARAVRVVMAVERTESSMSITPKRWLPWRGLGGVPARAGFALNLH